MYTKSGNTGENSSDVVAQAKAEPPRALTIGIGHVFAAFDFAVPTPYYFSAQARSLNSLSIWSLISGFIVFSGVAGLLSRWIKSKIAAHDFLLDGIAITTAAILPILAVESRFALPAFAVLAIRASQASRDAIEARNWPFLIGGLLFGMCFALLCVLLHQISSAG